MQWDLFPLFPAAGVCSHCRDCSRKQTWLAPPRGSVRLGNPTSRGELRSVKTGRTVQTSCRYQQVARGPDLLILPPIETECWPGLPTAARLWRLCSQGGAGPPAPAPALVPGTLAGPALPSYNPGWHKEGKTKRLDCEALLHTSLPNPTSPPPPTHQPGELVAVVPAGILMCCSHGRGRRGGGPRAGFD